MTKGLSGEHEHRLAQMREETIYVVWRWDEYNEGGTWKWSENEEEVEESFPDYTSLFPDYEPGEENSLYNDIDATDEELIEEVRRQISEKAHVVIQR